MLNLDINFFKTKCLQDFGDVQSDLDSDQVISRLAKLFKYKRNIPKVPPYLLKDGSHRRLPKWKDMMVQRNANKK
jgi:hypothetical protein